MRSDHSHSAVLDVVDTGWRRGSDSTSPARLNVTVIHTSEEGTVAALLAAERLAKNLCAYIRVVAAEVVPIHFSLERPHVPAAFLEGRLCGLIRDAGLGGEDVTIQIALCRSSKRALAELLAAHSLVVIAGNVHWWSRRRECRMARWLRRWGHQVVFVDAAEGKRPYAERDLGRQATFYRSMGMGEI